MKHARVIDGKVVASRIKLEAAELVRALLVEGVRVSLDVVMVGDPASGEIYTRSQRLNCQEVGIEHRLHALPPGTSENDIRNLIRRLNQDSKVTGILLNLPLPAGIDTPAIQYCIDPYKDVEGVNPANLGLLFYDQAIIAPCTALAVMEMVKEAGIEVRGLNAVVVGQGAIGGRPVSLFLLHESATVTSCHIATRDLHQHTRQADLLIVAAGCPALIGREHVKTGAVVIDVGINSVLDSSGERRVVGDVVFEEVREVASVITPVPGGVGPVTTAILIRSAAQAAHNQHHQPRRIDA
ncbi:MAG: bifunctional 5,10-methylenetetrahydrofolate dehydrogenase/5,10-methenyltetrahydrofolate cyclohydrolase [Planctomycetota bacterium]